MTYDILRFQAQCERGMPTEAWEATHSVGAAAWLHWLREGGWREFPEHLRIQELPK